MLQGHVKAEKLLPLKITVVGDTLVGKTCLFIAYTDPSVPIESIQQLTVFDDCSKMLTVDGLKFDLTIWDTSGAEEYEKLRSFSYLQSDCVVLCYAVDNRNSYDSVKFKWIKEVRNYCPTAPVLLVATKADRTAEVSKKKGKRLKAKIKASGFIQCSAKTRDNIDKVFAECARAVMRHRAKGLSCPLV